MDNLQENEKEKDSSVFNYMESLSPIRYIESNSITQRLSSLSFESLTSVFTSEESCFTRQSNTYDPSKYAFASIGVNEEEEEEIKIKPPQVPKHDWTSSGVIFDNVKASETPYWNALIPNTIQMIYDPRNVSEAFSFLPQQSTSNSNSNARANNETESSNAFRRVRQCIDVEDKSVGNEYSVSRNINVGLQCSTTLFLNSNVTVREYITGRDTGQEHSPSRPNKKRGKYKQEGGECSSKGCSCKRSKCLKLYCECFAAGVHCTESCSCLACSNTPIHNDIVLATRRETESRNPHAFAPKVTRSSGSIMQVGDVASENSASARHRRGCNCKKSNCLKKYCECFQGGVGCSINCRCEGCKNEFGTKDVR